MLKYRADIKEIVIGRFTRMPDEKQIERNWFEAKRAQEIGRDFPKRNRGIRATPKGFEIFVTRA